MPAPSLLNSVAKAAGKHFCALENTNPTLNAFMRPGPAGGGNLKRRLLSNTGLFKQMRDAAWAAKEKVTEAEQKEDRRLNEVEAGGRALLGLEDAPVAKKRTRGGSRRPKLAALPPVVEVVLPTPQGEWRFWAMTPARKDAAATMEFNTVNFERLFGLLAAEIADLPEPTPRPNGRRGRPAAAGFEPGVAKFSPTSGKFVVKRRPGEMATPGACPPKPKRRNSAEVHGIGMKSRPPKKPRSATVYLDQPTAEAYINAGDGEAAAILIDRASARLRAFKTNRRRCRTRARQASSTRARGSAAGDDDPFNAFSPEDAVSPFAWQAARSDNCEEAEAAQAEEVDEAQEEAEEEAKEEAEEEAVESPSPRRQLEFTEACDEP